MRFSKDASCLDAYWKNVVFFTAIVDIKLRLRIWFLPELVAAKEKNEILCPWIL